MARNRPPFISSRLTHFGAPTGGWNSYANVTQMDPTDAFQLDNMFPETTYVRLRHGSQLYAQLSGTPGPVKSLFSWSSVTGDKLLAAYNGSIWDLSGASMGGTPANWDHVNWDNFTWSGLAGTSIASGFTSDIWQGVNFATISTPIGQYWIGVNGTGKQWIYNGTTFVAGVNTLGPSAAPAPDSNKFSCITDYQGRLFFTTDDNLFLYYLNAPGIYQGELHAINLGQLLPKGGAIACMATWTRDNGAGGMDDVLVIVSTHGEVLCYLGTNPDDLSMWNFLGRYQVGRPVSGHRQLVKLGPDLMLICEDGFQAMAKYLALGTSQALTTAISRKIGNAVTQAVSSNKDLFGWEAILWPTRNALLVNVPQPALPEQQFVVNTITGSWCRFLGLNAYCWCVVDKNIYFGSINGMVIQADIGADDQGQPISYEMVTSFQLPGGTAQVKRATMVRPYFMADGPSMPTLDVNVDYNVQSVGSPITFSGQTTQWDNFNWDQANWNGDLVAQTNWYSVQGLGNSFAVHLSGKAKALTLNLLAFDLAFESGSGMV